MFGRGMQDCFRLHPEMYGSELEDDEDDVEDEIRAQEAQRAQETDGKSQSQEADSPAKSQPLKIAPTSAPQGAEKEIPAEKESPKAALKTEEVKVPTSAPESSEEAVPRAAYDASSK